MAITTLITIVSGTEAAGDITERLHSRSGSHPNDVVNGLANYMNGLAGGQYQGSVDVSVNRSGAARASGTITFSGTGAANDTILINGVTFTAKSSGATGDQWNVGASATLSAAALAAAINASASALVSGHVTASSALGVVTITSKSYSVAGNAVTIAEGVDGSSHMAVSGARLTGGTNPTANLFSFA
jgi:hypothetical protein